MTDKKYKLNDEQTEQVVGGLFDFHKSEGTVTYTHQDGSVTTHKCLDYAKAWERCCQLEAKNWDEDKIFQDLIDNKYIAP